MGFVRRALGLSDEAGGVGAAHIAVAEGDPPQGRVARRVLAQHHLVEVRVRGRLRVRVRVRVRVWVWVEGEGEG